MKTFLNLSFLILINLVLGLYSCGQTNEAPIISPQKTNTIPFTPLSDFKMANNSIAKIDPLYRSLDRGKTWTSFANGIPKTAVISGFASVQNKIYAATDYHGVFISLDGADEWNRLDSGLPQKIDINAILAFDHSLVIGTFRQGFFISKDEGKTWHSSKTNLSKTPIRSLLKINEKLLAGTDNGIYESIDQGNTWTHSFGAGIQINNFTALDHKVYAAVVDGAIMSKDDGANWEYIYKPYTLHNISNDGDFIYAMVIGGGLLKSNDDGQNWTDINDGLDPPQFYTFEVKHLENDVFAAQHYGIYHSTDHGEQWTKLKNYFPETTAFLMLEVTDFGLLTGVKSRNRD